MRLIFPLSLIFLFACSSQPNLRDDLSGTWNMIGVKIYDQDANSELNPTGDRWLQFRTDGTFTSGSSDEQENAGTYILEESTRALSLDSDAGPGDDSYWKISLKGDTLLMRGVGTERQERSEVILVR